MKINKNKILVLYYKINEYKKISSLLSKALLFLDETEQTRLKKYRFLKDKLNFLIGRIIAKSTLNEQCPYKVRFSYNNFGKPSIITGNTSEYTHFNISHTENLVTVVLSNLSKIGIDAAKIKSIEINNLVEHFASSAEKNKILGSKNILTEFYKVWTMKEAYLKALGTGIGNNLCEINMYDKIKKENIYYRKKIIDKDFYISIVAFTEAKKKDIRLITREIKDINYLE